MGNGFRVFLLRGEPQRGEEPLLINTLLPNNVRKNKIRKELVYLRIFFLKSCCFQMELQVGVHFIGITEGLV